MPERRYETEKKRKDRAAGVAQANPSPPQETQGRLLSDDEKVDRASLESMDASDPPPYTPLRVGAPPKRRQKRKSH